MPGFGQHPAVPPAKIDVAKRSFDVGSTNLLWSEIHQNGKEHRKTVTVPHELFTRRLHLRRPAEADAPAIIAIAGDWDVARRLGRVLHPYTQEHFRFFIERVVPSEPTWAIVRMGFGLREADVAISRR